MNSIKLFLTCLIALWCIFGLANGNSQKVICVPLGSLPYDPFQSDASDDCSVDGFYINRSEPRRFHQCYGHMRFEFECQIGLQFDVARQRCEWSKNLECNPLKERCPEGSIPVIPTLPTTCSKSDRSYYNDPSKPSSYCQCFDGVRHDFECQPKTYFDRVNTRCEWITKMKCFNYIPISY